MVRICATACVTTCGECQGLDCYNTIEEDRHGLEDADDRNFFETLFH